MKIDSQDRLWLSLSNGEISLLDKNLDPVMNFTDLSGNEILYNKIITETAENEILFPGHDGIYRYNEESKQALLFIKAKNPAIVEFNPISKTYYVGTSDRGLLGFHRDGSLVKHINTQQRIADPYIRSVQIIGESEIWVGTENGLSRIDLKKNETRNYYQADGLQGNQYFPNASYKGSNGFLYFGGTNGLSMFNPSQLRKNERPPFVYIDRISLFDNPINHFDAEPLIDVHPQALEALKLNWKRNQHDFPSQQFFRIQTRGIRQEVELCRLQTEERQIHQHRSRFLCIQGKGFQQRRRMERGRSAHQHRNHPSLLATNFISYFLISNDFHSDLFSNSVSRTSLQNKSNAAFGLGEREDRRTSESSGQTRIHRQKPHEGIDYSKRKSRGIRSTQDAVSSEFLSRNKNAPQCDHWILLIHGGARSRS